MESRLSASPSTASRARRRYQEAGQCTRRRGGAHRRVTTQQQDHSKEGEKEHCQSLAKMSSSSPRVCMLQLERSGTNPVRRLRGLDAQECGLCLQPKAAQSDWHLGRDHQDWQIHHWRPVLVAEESRFTLSTCDRRDRVWRRRGEWFAASDIIPRDRFGGGSVMVLGRHFFGGSSCASQRCLDCH